MRIQPSRVRGDPSGGRRAHGILDPPPLPSATVLRMPSARGTLTWSPAASHLELLAAPVAAAVADVPDALVAPIDPTLADTASFCEAYDVAPGASANCVVVAGRRGETVRYAAVMVLATHRADVNGVVRRHLGSRKISFAAHDDAVGLTGMEFGGITPVGLPEGWPILVDEAVVAAGEVVVGSGLRRSKLLLTGDALLTLPGAERLALASPLP
jgi:prolyl-tRNA editing enzyme YbaK/EbsC (Cys-tRNA(Pro) deacylase)